MGVPRDTEREALLGRLRERIVAELDGLVTAPYALLDFPDHAGVGESAVWLGTTAFLREHSRAPPSYVASIAEFSAQALAAALPEGPILIRGGGSFGDVRPQHLEFVDYLLRRFPDRPVIQLPQSMQFDDAARVASAAQAIARQGRFQLFVRDRAAEGFATAHFDCAVRLCPDLSLCLGALQRPVEAEVDVLYLLRTDSERTTDPPGQVPGTARITDWPEEKKLAMRAHQLVGIAGALRAGRASRLALREARYQAAARARLGRGCRTLAQGRAVITDRVQGHLLSLLLGIPHAALDSRYGALGRFFETWISQGEDVHLSRSMADAERWASAVIGRGR